MRFSKAYGEAVGHSDKLANTINSSHAIETSAWMQRIDGMREFLGPRVIDNMKHHDQILKNREFEKTIGCKATDIKDDSLGLFNQRIELLARTAAYLPTQLILEALAAGETISNTATTFDGLPFFSASHDLDSAGVQSNLTTGAATFNATSWENVRVAMRSLTAEDGRPLGVMPNLVFGGPEYELEFKTVLQAERSANGATNVQEGEAQYFIIDELGGSGAWYAMDNRKMAPFIYQNRESVTLTSKVDSKDDNVFMLNEYLWGLYGRGAAGYGPWWLIHKNRA